MEKFSLPALDSGIISVSSSINAKDEKLGDLSGAGEVLWKVGSSSVFLVQLSRCMNLNQFCCMLLNILYHFIVHFSYVV